MSFSSAMRRGLLVAILVLSNASLHLADRRSNSDGEVNTVRKPHPKKSKETTSKINLSQCDGTSIPIFPPSITYSYSLWSVKALMSLQILPDGTVNGTLTWNKYVELNIQVLSENGCMVRIQGAASQRYLAMGQNGSLITQTQPDETRSVFNAQLEKSFVTFKNGNFFIAMKQGGTIKKIKGGKKGRNHKRSSKFVLLPPIMRQENEDSTRKDSARKRRFPADLGLGQTRLNNLRLKLFSDLQRR